MYMDTFRGNQLDHVIHRQTLETFAECAGLKFKGIAPEVKPVFDVAVESNFMVHGFLKARDYLGAMHLSSVAAQSVTLFHSASRLIYTIGSDVAIGSSTGIINGYANMAHMVDGVISDPIRSTKDFIRSVHALGSAIGRLGMYAAGLVYTRGL